jgi:uncharacterized membrane protein
MSAHTTIRGKRFHRWLNPDPRPGPPVHPSLLQRERRRAEDRQNRVADGITHFSGSMLFVYVHIVWFACWIGLGVEGNPYGLLTMIVSLEAIFLSTFVLISQNRADARRQLIADEQWKTVQEEDRQNLELLRLSNQILALTQDVRSLAGSFVDRADIAGLTKEVRSLAGALARPGAQGTANPRPGKPAT